MIATLTRLAFSGIRSRILPSVVCILLTGAAAATITLALEVRSTAIEPWTRTFDAANGAHILANVASEALARQIAELSEAAESDRPIPVVRAIMKNDGQEELVFLAGLSSQPTVNKPVTTDGDELRSGGIVLERSLARALRVPVGTYVTFESASGPVTLEVVGNAIVPSQGRFPRSNPGIAWVTRSDLERIVPDQSNWRWTEAIRLNNPSGAPFVAETVARELPPETFSLETWQEQRDSALQEAEPFRVILSMYTLLLLIVSYSVLAILIGARVTSQYREIALLKAVGLTPRQVSVVFTTESAGLTVIGVVIGFAPGAILAPHLTATASATLLGSPTVEANLSHMLLSGIVILPIVVLSAYLSAGRSSRSTVMQTLRAGVPVPAKKSRLARLSAIPGLPIPMELGLKDLLARRSRALWLMFAIGITGAATIVTLSAQAAIDNQPAGKANDIPSELSVLVYTLDALLAVITICAIVGIALLSVRERIRDFGILKVVGLTPSQITTSLVGAHSLLALFASTISIPIGLVLYLMLYQSTSGDSGALSAPFWRLMAVPVVMTIATAIVTWIPAWIGARIPASTSVRYE